ncbi:MAG TPA: diguanylate cyclase [Gammaproteobacteria bacterium]|nr:diguanylate cyclase [Gammaproteobacteria bacterium]
MSRPSLAAFPNSPYAAELARGAASRSFSPAIEAEYVRAHLVTNRAFVRVAAVLGVLLPALRVLEQLMIGAVNRPLELVGVIFAASAVLAVLAWSPLYSRVYLPVAQVLVPIRGVVAAVGVAQVAALGQLELLMLMPLMVLGPFFFLGLRFRAALFAVAVSVVAFMAAAVYFGLPAPIASRSIVVLLMTIAACAIAARHLEKWSRTSFLEGHLIAELAEHDTLTGLKNRRVFDEHLDRLWEQAVDDGRAMALLMIDIDHFKAYNDRYGHQAGDHTLRRVAQALQPFVSRPLDVLARYGGEEFAVIFYDIDIDQARDVAERMRGAVGELAIEHHGSSGIGMVTISVGVAAVEPSPGRRSRGALQLADQALYEAKVRGRNRVELLDDVAHRVLVTGVFAKSSFARK